jgi:hypothetical protein
MFVFLLKKRRKVLIKQQQAKIEQLQFRTYKQVFTSWRHFTDLCKKERIIDLQSQQKLLYFQQVLRPSLSLTHTFNSFIENVKHE